MGSLPLERGGLEGLSIRDWYLVLSNHRSWVDILVLQAVFNRRIPFLKFFLKRATDLGAVPRHRVVGARFPVHAPLRGRRPARSTPSTGKDLEVTRRACEKFRLIPTSVMNFVEGTRFTPAKHAALIVALPQPAADARGRHFVVLSAMGGMLHSLLDVTIAYTTGTPSLWDLCCGRVGTVAVVVDVRRRPIDAWMSAGDYANDPAFRERFEDLACWIWVDKDALLDRLLK